MRRLFAIPLAVALLGTMSAPAPANLGDREEQALKRELRWRSQFGANRPRVDVDAQGRVVRECWLSPSKGWFESTALSFAALLLPPDLADEVPTRIDADGAYVLYAAPGGYRIYLQVLGRAVLSAEVRAPEFDGDRC